MPHDVRSVLSDCLAVGECLWVMAATGIAAMLSAIGMVAAIYIRKKRNRAVRRNVLNGPKHTVPEGPSDGTVRVG
jgi:hypothetical protein